MLSKALMVSRVFALVLLFQALTLNYVHAQGSWNTASPLPTARFYLAAATSPDGRIYAIGGTTDEIGVLSTVEAYDPSANTWTTKAPMPTARFAHVAATGLDGRIYVMGGFAAGGLTNKTEAYNPSSNTWSTVAPMPLPRLWAGATTGADGRIYVVGGYDSNVGSQPGTNTLQIYDPGSNSWTVGSPMSVIRYVDAAASGPDGRIYAIGGGTTTGSLSAVEAYDSGTGLWHTASSLLLPRQRLAAVTGLDGNIYAIGGGTVAGITPVATVEAYDVITNAWSLAASMPTARWGLAGALGLDGHIYAIGGSNNDGSTALASVEVFTPFSATTNISSVTASNSTQFSELITWKTNVPANSVVEYGTSGYTNLVSAPQLVTNHALTLAGLTANTVYHYRVKSTDASGKTVTGGDFTFAVVTSIQSGMWSYSITRRPDQSYLLNGSITYISDPFNPYLWTNVTLSSIQLGSSVIAYGQVAQLLSPGQTARFAVVFPASVGKPGTTAILRFAGSYDEAPFGTIPLNSYGFRALLP